MKAKTDKARISPVKRIVFLFLTMLAAMSASYAQTTNTAEQTTTPNQEMLHPDEHTQYMDEQGNKIETQQFMAAIQTGKYAFNPETENGRIKSMRLKKAGKSAAAGEPAPDFSITDINGKHYSLKEMHGKTIIMNFWFTACMPCVQEIPELNGLYKKYEQDPNVVFLAITHDQANTVKNFILKKNFKFNVVANEQALITQYGISSFPTTIVIDKNGGIAFMLSGYDKTNVPQLDAVISALK